MNYESQTELYEFLREAILVETVGYTREMSLRLEELSRERVSTPLILVSSGTSAMVAGADKTFRSVGEYLSDRNIDAQTARCGFIGIGNFEPMLSIQFPGKSRVIFHNITSEKVTPLLDDVFIILYRKIIC
jgi:hypothetical protein